MNGKLAKKIRRMAERATQGAPAVAYLRRNRPYMWFAPQETARLDPRCTRAVYQSMKRNVLRAGGKA